MKNYMRFTLGISLALACWSPAQACLEWEDPSSYNLFRCVESLSDIHEQRIDESVQFWSKFTGVDADELTWNIRYLTLSDFDDPDDNALLTTLTEKNELAALMLLRLNTELNELQRANDGWEYRKVTAADYSNLLDRVDQLKVTGELGRRKTFLKMRLLYCLKDYDACMTLWDRFASKWEPCPIRDRMEGYVAGIQYKNKEYDKAVDTYFRLGDDESIQLCVNRMLNSTDVMAEYERDPNSRILGYVLEDYANYYYHAIANSFDGVDGDDSHIWYSVTSESGKMEQFALKVAQEGKVKDAQMWQAFAGFMQMFRGQNDVAYETFCQAEKMKGDGIVKPLLRHYKFMAALESDHVNDQYLLDELVYQGKGNYVSQEEAELINRLYGYELNYRISDYICQREDFTVPFFFVQASYQYDRFWSMDGDLTIDHLKEIHRIMTEGSKDPLINGLKPYLHFTLNTVNEMLGTRLMREDRYDEAKTYLKQVEIEYLDNQSIAPYLAERHLPEHAFMREDYSDPDYSSAPHRNVKLEFCQQVIDLKSQIAHAEGATRAQLEYVLANILFQASPAGDMWALSSYSWSSYDNHRNQLNDQAGALLKDALAESRDYELTVKCYFGMAANPQEEGIEPFVEYDADGGSYYVKAIGEQYDAYVWLMAQEERSLPVYRTCDWLKLYVVEAEVY